MNREDAVKLTHTELAKYPELKDWSVRLTTQIDKRHNFLGLCSYKDKVIILNAHHLDIHPDPDIVDTIRHEIAHALCPGQGHNDIWASKAKELGCDSIAPCSNLSFTPEIIDAIRSGAEIEITFEEEVIRRPKYQITRLQDKCEVCGKVAKTRSEVKVDIVDETKPDLMFITLECGHMIVKQISKGTPFQSIVSGGDPSCKHEWKKNLCLSCGAFRPFDFQVEGMRFIEAALSINKGAAIFDEMGLGKTIQALGYLKFHPEKWPVLYIVKSGIKFQWFKQILTWMGDEFVGQIIQSTNDILIPGLRTYIVSYDMLVPKTKKLKSGKTVQQGFDINKIIGHVKTIVLDECQQIKNPDSSRTQQVRKIAKDVDVIALSGTPWKNRGSELFSVLNMMAPMKFGSYQNYLERWVQFYWDGKYNKEGGIRKPQEFREYIKDIAIRRERVNVMSELPLVNRTKLFVKMAEDENKLYEEEVDRFVAWYNEAIIGGEEVNSMNILAKMSKMRHLAGIAKVPATIEYVEDFIEETDRKIVVFVHHQDVGKMIFTELQEKFSKDMPVLQLTSAMSGQDRFTTQETFNASSRSILVASTLAAGEGLNLQTCADCVMHERQWNPANEEQAEGRFIRIGQTAVSVNATYTEATDSIDEHFDGIVERKRHQYYQAMTESGEAPKWNQNDIVKEIADVIVRKHRNRSKAA